MKLTGFYAGSFDPPTRGHFWMINEALKIVDHLIIGVGVNPAKQGLFRPDKRIELITSEFQGDWRIGVCTYSGLTVQEAIKQGASILFRGIRSASDFDYELMQRYVNDDIAKLNGTPPTTIFLAPPPELAMVSSSMVKSLVGFGDWETILHKYVTLDVIKALKHKHDS